MKVCCPCITGYQPVIRERLKKRGLRHQLSQPSLGSLVRNVDRGLAEALLEVGADSLDELGAVDSLSLNTFHQVHEVILSRINITY